MNKTKERRLVIAHGSIREEVILLLKQNGLPVSDIDDSKILFAFTDGDDVIGTGGLELFEGCALLRSLSIRRDWQGNGLGKTITRALEEICREKAIKEVYLLTETAEGFFKKDGYRVIDRVSAPLSIRNTSEFTTVCSSTGTLMYKSI